MVLTGERGVTIEGCYPVGVSGRAMVRRDLDWLLLRQAVAAGCQFEPGAPVQRVVVADESGRRKVTGVAVGGGGRARTIAARVVIAADGRRSAIAFGLGVARHPARPRRWAVGAYFADFAPLMGVVPAVSASFGEMHVRRNCYIGVARIPDGLTNVCLVKPSRPADPDLRDPAALLLRELAHDPVLRDRVAAARLVNAPVVLGPLAVDVTAPLLDGLLLAGDAAGFIDPMTGDGLRFAVRGGELAAEAALDALANGWSGVHARLARARRREFAGKWRFNRTLRALVASPRGVAAATVGGRLAPPAFRAIIAHAGDCAI
jgi:flavin-dependent dehydrogenase